MVSAFIHGSVTGNSGPRDRAAAPTSSQTFSHNCEYVVHIFTFASMLVRLSDSCMLVFAFLRPKGDKFKSRRFPASGGTSSAAPSPAGDRAWGRAANSHSYILDISNVNRGLNISLLISGNTELYKYAFQVRCSAHGKLAHRAKSGAGDVRECGNLLRFRGQVLTLIQALKQIRCIDHFAWPAW